MPKLKVLLIGAGNFGVNYIRVLKDLDVKEEIEFVGVVVTSQQRAGEIETRYQIPAFLNYKEKLSEVDAVCIVTPPETHFNIALDCIPFVNVLIEKPLAFSVDEVLVLENEMKKYGNVLMSANIFRFHEVSKKLKSILGDEYSSRLPNKVKGIFLNPKGSDVGRPVSFELLHWFDLVDFLFPKIKTALISVVSSNDDRVKNIVVGYQDSFNGDFVLGWDGDEKQRSFQIEFDSDNFIIADYITNIVTVSREGSLRQYQIEPHDSLSEEINIFIKTIYKEIDNPVLPEVAVSSIKVAEDVLKYDE